MTSSTRHRFPLSILGLAIAATVARAGTLPTNPKVVQGNVTFGQSAGRLDVTQSTASAIVNWQAFSVGATDHVVFNQPTSQSVILNRVTGTDPSSIFGRIDANGKVFIVNPNGVLFGASSSVNTAALVASTLDLSDSDFSAGHYVFSRSDAGAPAVVDNEGVLSTTVGGTVAMLGGTVTNAGTVSAPAGAVVMGAGRAITLDLKGDGLTLLHVTASEARSMAAGGVSAADAPAYAVNQRGVVRARGASLKGGVIVLDGGDGDVAVSGTLDAGGDAKNDAGSVIVRGGDVGLLESARIDVSGRVGGQVVLDASTGAGAAGVVALAPQSQIDASAFAGNGGLIEIDASSARTQGALLARGGTVAGDGGLIKLNVSGGVDTRGVRVDASAPHGKAGTVNVDPFDVFIVDGPSAGPPPPTLNPFVPVADSVVSTTDIDAALDAGTNVNITTGTGSGPFSTGTITFGFATDSSVNILKTTGAAPVTLRLDAAGSIVAFGPILSIKSTAGPLNVDLDSNSQGFANGDGGVRLVGASIATNGGAVRIFGGGDPLQPAIAQTAGVELRDVVIDTRTGQSDSGAGGLVSLRGLGVNDPDFQQTNGVSLVRTTLRTSSGAILIDGRASPDAIFSSGVGVVDSTLATTTGDIGIVGVGSRNSVTGADFDVLGVLIGGASSVSTVSGAVDVRARGQTLVSSAQRTVGLQLDSGAAINAGPGAPLTISATSDGADTGLDIEGSVTATGRDIVLRGSNTTSTGSSVVIGGSVSSTGFVDLRPGSVDTSGGVTDRNDIDIRVGGASAFAPSAASLANISADTLVLGSDAYGGTIAIGSAMTPVAGRSLTLQTGSGGSIVLDAPVDVGSRALALVSPGPISESSTAGISAAALLVRAGGTSGAALDGAPTNAIGVLAANTGTAPLAVTSGGALEIGGVVARGVSGATGAAVDVGTSGIVAGSARLQALGGDLTLSSTVTATSLDLITSGTLQNPTGQVLNAPDWRVWADTWVGEARGGLAGNGSLPNLYDCGFGFSCLVTIPSSGHTFIYASQPALTVTVDSLSRVYGDANPTFTLSGNGLVNGDTVGQVVAGTPSTSAAQTSDVGSYGISGASLTSVAGYSLTVVDGRLDVTPRALTVAADNAARTYGGTNPAFAGTVAGLASFDAPGALSLAFASPATTTSDVGSYAIQPTVSGPSYLANYTVTTVNGALSVTPAPLVISAPNASRTYGASNPVFSGSVNGLVAGDTVADLGLNFATTATASSNVGGYAIGATLGNAGKAANYDVQQVNGTLTVVPAPLVVTTFDATRVYGDANPAFAGQVSGLVAGDTQADLGLSFGSSATAASHVGSYTIAPSFANALRAGNYDVQQVSGTLAVTPATLVMTADPATRDYLKATPTLSGTITGWRNGDTQAGATTGTLTWSSPALKASPVGTYAIDGSGLSAGDYVFVQAASNATALHVVAPDVAPIAAAVSARDSGLAGIAPVRQDLSTYVYDHNFGQVSICTPESDPVSRSQEGSRDILAIEWSRVRTRPNVSTCFDSGRKNGCDAF